MGYNRTSLTKTLVLKAARDCFQRYGVRRTSMADVAEELGVSRQTIYRLFESRSDLLESMASELITKIGKKLAVPFASFENLEDALVEGSLLSITAGANDALFVEIIEQSDDHQFEQFLFRGSEEVQTVMLKLWEPLLEKARSEGRLKSDLTNEKAVEWIRNVHAVATLRTDYDENQRRALFNDFLVPSLIRE